MTVRKYLGYIIFGALVLIVVGVAINHSRYVAGLVGMLAHGTPEQRKSAAAELIKGEQFGDSITGEPVPVRVEAAKSLAFLGTVDAVKQAMPMLKDIDKPVRMQSIATLQQIGGATQANLTELMNGLKDGDINVRKGTLAVLTATEGGIGPRTNPDVVQAVLSIMKKEDAARGPGGDVLSSPLFVRSGANARSVPALMAFLDEKDDGVKRGAADALGKIGDKSAVQKLIAVMHDPKISLSVRRVVVAAIAVIAAPEGESALTEAVTNPNDDAEARAQAAAGLGKIASPSAIATLVRTLTDPDNQIRSAAIASLARAARSGPNDSLDPEGVTQLTRAAGSPDHLVRLGAIQALLSVHAPAANAALIQALTQDHTEADVRSAAAAALGYSGNRAAVTPLIQSLNDPQGEVATAAVDALSAIGPDATAALIQQTRQGDITAYYAAQALGKQGRAALPALQQAASGATSPAQRWTAVALGETHQPEARPTLEQLAKSADPNVSSAARQQLDRLGSVQN